MNTRGQNRTERRLAAILAADVAGYSRLIGADEEGTLDRLRSIRAEVIDPKTAAHRGRLVKTTGDGLLVEFASVVDALRCATEMQQALADRTAGVPPAQRIEFRIGINVGDVVVEDGDIFGDGVNVAARLEGLADPGGICVSARVQEDAAGRLDLAFEDLGEQSLKNIARPVRVYRIAGPRASRPQSPHPNLQWGRLISWLGAAIKQCRYYSSRSRRTLAFRRHIGGLPPATPIWVSSTTHERSSPPCAPSPLSSSRKPLLYETRSSANSCCRACDWPSARQRDSASSEPYPKRRIGLALFEAQIGRKARYAKPLRGYGGAGVLEVVDDFDGDTFRAVYTVRFAEAVYVLHAFQKKSRRGIATPRSEIELIRTRLRRAAEDYERWQKSEKRTSR